MPRQNGYVIPKKLSVWELEELQKPKFEAKPAHPNIVVEVKKAVVVPPRFVEAPLNITANIVGHDYKLVRALHNKNEITFPSQLEPVWEAWHGTSIGNVHSIGTKGLTAKRGRVGCLFGPGIYLSRDIMKAKAYARSNLGVGEVLTLLRCKVAMGNILQASRSFVASSQVGYDKLFNSLWCASGSTIQGAWGNYVAHEEIVVYDDRQVVVQDIYVFAERRDVEQRRVQEEPKKQRVSQTVAARNHYALKDRKSKSAQLAKHHICVQDGIVCAWATLHSGNANFCLVHKKYVTQNPYYSNYAKPNCSRWSPLVDKD